MYVEPEVFFSVVTAALLMSELQHPIQSLCCVTSDTLSQKSLYVGCKWS